MFQLTLEKRAPMNSATVLLNFNLMLSNPRTVPMLGHPSTFFS